MRLPILGALALGVTFNAPDLLAYFVGIALGGGLEILRHRIGVGRSAG